MISCVGVFFGNVQDVIWFLIFFSETT